MTHGFWDPALQAHFGLGLRDAADRLGICATTLKRACRRVGIQRWPRRLLPAGGGSSLGVQQGVEPQPWMNPITLSGGERKWPRSREQHFEWLHAVVPSSWHESADSLYHRP